VQVLREPGHVECSPATTCVVTQGPAKGTLPFGELETREGRVQVRTTSRRRTVEIGDDRPVTCDDSQQLTLGDPLTTSDARPDGAGGTSGVLGGHQREV
jgi:hypothetical protein